MKARKCIGSLALLLAAMLPAVSSAQVEKLPETKAAELIRRLPEVGRNAASPYLREHLAKLPAPDDLANKRRVVNAVRVALDLEGKELASPIVHYRVPAASDAQYLEDAYPYNGEVLAPVTIISGADAYEPGSFLLYPLLDIGKAELVLSALNTKDGRVFPQEDLDLKVVKVWYQNGNGWYSYFMDEGGLKLTPELLLHDEGLIVADQARGQNYARVKDMQGKDQYVWITTYKKMEDTFKPVRANFADADTLQPVSLEAGKFKQFFLTAHVAAKTPPGLYTGSIAVRKDGRTVADIPVRIRVLPLTLPSPKCHFDDSRDFICKSGHAFRLDQLGYDRFYKIMADFRRHGIDFAGAGYPYQKDTEDTIKILKDLGFRLDGNLVSGGWRHVAGDNRYAWRNTARRVKKFYEDMGLGGQRRVIGYGDEPGDNSVKKFREQYDIYQSEGFSLGIAGHGSIYRKAAYAHSDVMIATVPEDAETTRKWNEIGFADVSWYSSNHNSTENPGYTRRQYGLAPWLANFSAIQNNQHSLGPYNDRSRTTYKPFVDSYNDGKGHITTLQFEGKRDGINDMRYATLLRSLAKKAAGSPDFRIANRGRIALQFIADINSVTDDLETVRMEMINHILALQKLVASR